MKVLFLMISYPNVDKNKSMYTDLAQEFFKQGHIVYVAVANGPSKTEIRSEGEIKVLRIRSGELFNTSLLKKGITNLLLPVQVLHAVNKYFHGIHFDSIIVPTPPITYSDTAKKLKERHHSPVYLILRDIFPQNAKDLGLIRNPLLLKYFCRKEKELYSVADYIGCMSQGNINYLKKHNPEVKEEKLHILYNWKNISNYCEQDELLKSKLGLENKFIALYGGNLGKPQKIDFILDLAGELAFLDNVIFLLIGEGTEKPRITNLVAKKNLKNVVIKDTLPRHLYEKIVRSCDTGLVNLSDRFTIPNIPSRTLAYWEAKLPILASIDRCTDYSGILEESESGLWSITGDLESYKKNFLMLYYDEQLRKKMGEKGYNYLLHNCPAEKAYKVIAGKLSHANSQIFV